MKGIALVCLMVVTVVSAELPGYHYRQRNRVFSRQAAPHQAGPYAAAQSGPYPASQSGPYPASQSGPYPPSGWRPSGPAFTLPPRQEGSSPSQTYGTPSPTYGAPTTPIPPPQAEPETENVDVDGSGSDQNGKLTQKEPNQKQVVQDTPVAPAADKTQVAPVIVLFPQNQLQYQKLVVAPQAQVLPQGFQYFGQIQSPSGAPFVYTSQYFHLY